MVIIFIGIDAVRSNYHFRKKLKNSRSIAKLRNIENHSNCNSSYRLKITTNAKFDGLAVFAISIKNHKQHNFFDITLTRVGMIKSSRVIPTSRTLQRTHNTSVLYESLHFQLTRLAVVRALDAILAIDYPI